MKKSPLLLGLLITGFFGGCADLHEANRCYAVAKAICKSHCLASEDRCINELQNQCQESSTIERDDLDACIKAYRKAAGDDFEKCVDEVPDACDDVSAIDNLLEYADDYERSSSSGEVPGSGGSGEFGSGGSGAERSGTGGTGGSPYGTTDAGSGGNGGSGGSPYGSTSASGGTGGDGGNSGYGGSGGGGSGGARGFGGGNNEPYYSSDLFAQWDFDSPSGTQLYNRLGFCGSECNGTLVNFDDVSERDASSVSGWVSAGSIDGALRFDGQNDSVQLNTSSLFSNRTQFTIEARIRPADGATLPGRIIASSVTFGVELLYLSVDYYDLEFQVTDENLSMFSVFGYIPEPRSYLHVAATWSAYDSAYLYVNGQQVGENYTESYQTFSDTTTTLIGAGSPVFDSAYFRGDIDLLRVYSVRLSNDQVYQSYQYMTGN